MMPFRFASDFVVSKTTIFGVVTALFGIGGYIAGRVDQKTAIDMVCFGIGLVFLRDAQAKGDEENALATAIQTGEIERLTEAVKAVQTPEPAKPAAKPRARRVRTNIPEVE